MDKGFFCRGDEMVIYRTRAMSTEAEIAISLACRWGMVAAIPNGEDAQGRQKVRLLEPDEIVERACTTAAALMNEFQQRGWILEIPSLPESEQSSSAPYSTLKTPKFNLKS